MKIKILTIAGIVILALILLLDIGSYLYKKYTWQDRLKVGMTREEFESILPYSKQGVLIGTGDNYWTSFELGKWKLETNFEHHYTEDIKDDTLVRYQILKR